MLLEDLYILAKYIGAVPVSLWLEDYQRQSSALTKKLEVVLSTVERGSSAYTTVQDLVDVLQQSTPDETRLVHCLQNIAVLFNEQDKDNAELVLHYLESCQRFSKRVQTERQFMKLRNTLKNDLSIEEQLEYNKRLYLNEGMEYCLEYHLLVYRHLQDMNSEVDQRIFICQPEINIGSGNLPGLKADFMNDEVLEKFIYKILNDTERAELTKAYFFAKIMIIQAETVPINEVLKAFKKFIHCQLKSFQLMGINHLSSGFFQPYGLKPLIDDVAKQL